jgi:hypothetical protein
MTDGTRTVEFEGEPGVWARRGHRLAGGRVPTGTGA